LPRAHRPAPRRPEGILSGAAAVAAQRQQTTKDTKSTKEEKNDIILLFFRAFRVFRGLDSYSFFFSGTVQRWSSYRSPSSPVTVRLFSGFQSPMTKRWETMRVPGLHFDSRIGRSIMFISLPM